MPDQENDDSCNNNDICLDIVSEEETNEEKDEEIGEIPLEWNCLEGYYDCNDAKAIHYTDGVPLFDKYKDTPHAKLWLDRHELLLR